ncbi:stalk domain-containing protein [Paenibacillus vini]|uniref:Copper amine oxidase-like N-terminal domain-containing protein n=1 Tax=Paenibacillus vini TaxID=1476024 RepID=A0ABQ4M774_9BACL|nr:stalk domain-containing protein [Paenibacillus vini]GIP51840.1 hypothetical protein J42TS3_08750 [Paenibacillus vini]
MKKMLYLVVGVIIGASVGFGSTSFAAVKQFILTEFNRPVVVNGVIYKDAQNPILNYNGKTYLPLAKIGDLTGVNYKWNAEKKQVEIGSGTSQSGDSLTYIINDGKLTTIEGETAEQKAIREFTENNKPKVVEPFGLVNEEGWIFLYVKDKNGKTQKLDDNDDPDFSIYTGKRPNITKGWLNKKLLETLYGADVFKQDFTSIETKEVDGITYYKIENLISKGILK